FLLTLSLVLIYTKQNACTSPMLPRDYLYEWVEERGPRQRRYGTVLTEQTFHENNRSDIAEELVEYVKHYYDLIEYLHYCLMAWCLAFVTLGWCNIIPTNEDRKVLTIVMTIFIMGSMAMFAFFTAYLSFHRPCREGSATKSGFTIFLDYANWFFGECYRFLLYLRSYVVEVVVSYQQKWNLGNRTLIHNGTTELNDYDQEIIFETNLTSQIHFKRIIQVNRPKPIISTTNWPTEKVYKLEFRPRRDKRPVNVYEDNDDTMTFVTSVDAAVGFILLCSNFLFFFDSRQHMIEWRN
ncbi:hypothetical protein BLOT_010309, partial [Blomia tropicalis]